jgi:predicted RNA-binding protein
LFTAIGELADDAVYQADMGAGFTPFRRNVRFFDCQETSILPLIPQLSFIRNKQSWGGVFRFGMVEIPQADYELIASRMLGNSADMADTAA